MKRRDVLRISWPGFVILFTVTILAWVRPKNPVKEIEINGYAQGTTYHILYYAVDSVVTQNHIDKQLNRLNRSVSLYLSSSNICRFNRSTKGINVDEPFCTLIKKAIAINKATNGAVDVTVKPLVDAWGFGVKKPVVLPDSTLIKSIMSKVGMNKIWLQGHFLHKENPGVKIDMNGIAQGYTADMLAGILEQNHIDNYMVEIGGELRLKGHKLNGEKFKVGIEAINNDDLLPQPFQKIVTPVNGAVTTSGNYRKHLEAGGKQISHIINPKTGYPAQNEMISVTVWAKDGITADGYDNGFMVMGLNKTLKFLELRTDIGAYIIYRTANGTVADTVTPGFKKNMYTESND